MRFLTVLLAEDEPIISMDIRYQLESKGHSVIQASDWQSIIDRCEEYRPEIAIINFMQQHHTDGMALANMLTSRFKLQVMLLTGARSQDISASQDFNRTYEILHKPFTAAQLHRRVNACAT